MDSLDKQRSLVQKLLELTEAGSLQWKITADEKFFRIDLKKTSIQICELYKHGFKEYSIELLNDNGAVIDQFESGQIETGSNRGPYFSMMSSIYLIARRSATGADKILNDVLDELDQIIPF